MKPSIQDLFDQLARRLDALEGRLRRPEEQLGHRSIFTIDRAGEVPNAGRGNETKFLRGDGTWVTGSAGGAGLSSVSGTNIGTGIGVHASASVDGEMTFRSLSGSGGIVVSLVGSTVNVSGAVGLTEISGTNIGVGVGVHASASAGVMTFRSLSGSGGITVSLVGSTVKVDVSPMQPVGLMYPGIDGDPTFDGAATVLTLAPVANVYTMTRDIFAGTMTVNSGVTIRTVGRRIYANTVTGSGTIDNSGTNGGDGAVDDDGNAGVGGIGGATGLFAAGVNGATQAPGGATTNALPLPWSAGIAAGGGGTHAVGTAATVHFQGGGGGAGGDATINNVNYGAVTIDTTKAMLPPAMLFQGLDFNNAQFTYGASGGAGNRGDAGVGYFGGGGSGGGGGCVAIAAARITGPLTISARGGNGGNGAGSTTINRDSGGGGGGSGGGLIILLVGELDPVVTVTVAGGTGGAGGDQVASGGFSGFAGGDGFAGRAIICTSF